jgi:transcriptional regulator with XRE-family HTH domain
VTVKPQIINRNGKPAFAVIPIEEWNRIQEIIEDRADVAAVRAHQVNPGQSFPDAVLGTLLDGAHPVKVFREHRGLTQAELAKAAGTSAVYLSQIERGERPAGRKLLPRLAEALRVDIDMLEDTRKPRGYQVREARLALRKHPGGLSTAELARETGRDPHVVENVVRRLEEEGEVYDSGTRWRLHSPRKRGKSE